MNAKERESLIEEYGRGADLLTEALEAIPAQAWDFKPAPKEWSVRQLLGHMADSEMIGATRLYMIVAQPGSTLMSYDDDKWGQVLSHPGRNVDDALQLFRLVRQTNRQLLKVLPEGAFKNKVIHPDKVYPEFGEDYNVEKWLRIYTRHVRDHIQQLQAIHAAWKGNQGRA
jgi:hypothetical protein